MGRHAYTIRFKIHCPLDSQNCLPSLHQFFAVPCVQNLLPLRFSELQQKGVWKKILSNLIKLAHKQGKTSLQKFSTDSSSSIAAKKKGGGEGRDEIGYDGFKKILGTKIHVAVESNGLLISIRTSSANQHDSTTKFIDVLENISEFLNDGLILQIISAYTDKGYDAKYIRNHLICYGIDCCIPYKKNSKNLAQNKNQKQLQQNKICC